MMSKNLVVLFVTESNDSQVVNAGVGCFHCCTESRLIVVRRCRLVVFCVGQRISILKFRVKLALNLIQLFKTQLNLTNLDEQGEGTKLHLHCFFTT